jgi:hypothetical protein
MRSIMAFAISVTIIGAVGLTTSGSANAWDWGGMGYETANYRNWTHRYLGYQWGYNGWMWGLPYHAAPRSNSFGYPPSVVPGCRC